jgi:hypothetical protein
VGKFLRNKQLPFFALSFHIFDDNTYVFHTFDSDNYHLPEILNYSLIWTDSTFKVKHVNAYREKDKYSRLISKNNLDVFNNELYYKEPYNDTVFRVSSCGDIYYDFIFSFPENELPRELILQKNSRQFSNATRLGATNDYACNDFNPIVTSYFLFIPVSLNSRLFNIFYSGETNNVVIDSWSYRSAAPLLFSPPFSKILNCQGNTLIGYLDSHDLFKTFGNIKYSNSFHFLSEELIDFAKDVKENDNVIIVFSKLKNF